MKSSEIFIANILDEVEQTPINAFTQKTGLDSDDVNGLLEEAPLEDIDAFLLALYGLGYKISSPDGQYINFVEDI